MYISFGGQSPAIDVDANKTYYQTNALCDCVACQSFRKQVKKRYPRLTAFLEKFGVDAGRPDDILWVGEDESPSYECVSYSVAGEFPDGFMGEETIEDATPLLLTLDAAYVPSQRQDKTKYAISVFGIAFPCHAPKTPSLERKKPFGTSYVSKGRK